VFTVETIAQQLAASAVEAAVWLGLTFPILALAEGWARRDRGRWARGALGAAFVVVLMARAHFSLLDSERGPAALSAPPGGQIVPRGAGGRHGTPFWLGALNAFALYLAVFGAGLSRAYARQAELRREDAARREALLHAQREEAARREATLQMQLAEARLDALRRQLDPHFLFNTLNSVSALVARDPAGVRSMIARLSELLRFSFEDADRAEIPLREELALLGRYIEIMEVRFQGRLIVDQRVDERVLDALVPTMVLQPIVENAIRHGVERRKGTGHVVVEACAEPDAVLLRVTDDGPGPGAPTGASTPARGPGAARRSIGLANTVARLAHLYGEAASFTLAPGIDGGAVAEIRLPRRAVAAAA